MDRFIRLAAIVGLLGAPAAAMAQNAAVKGHQKGQPSRTQNQPQMQTNMAQEPPNVRVLPPSPDAQKQPNPMPALSR